MKLEYLQTNLVLHFKRGAVVVGIEVFSIRDLLFTLNEILTWLVITENAFSPLTSVLKNDH